jgi:hypothetical protein
VDEADIADERIAIEMRRLLQLRRRAGPQPTGRCLWCGEPVRPPLRWCDVSCRDDWERAHERIHR